MLLLLINKPLDFYPMTLIGMRRKNNSNDSKIYEIGIDMINRPLDFYPMTLIGRRRKNNSNDNKI
jgi:hypothetical protein